MTEADEDHWAPWRAWLARWDRLVEGLRGGRPGLDDAWLDEVHEQGVQEPMLGVGNLLGGHEQGFFDLTPEEEDELWELAAEEELSDDEVMNSWVRARSVRDRPVRRVRAKRPLRGGGHGSGRGLPGKSEFPSSWSDDETIARTMDVARHPSGAVELPSGDFRAEGERGRVLLAVLVSPEGDVLTSYPVRGDGVVQNPLSPEQEPLVQRLRALVEQVPPGAARDALEELLDVGEWPHVLASLRALGADPRELDALAAYVS